MCQSLCVCVCVCGCVSLHGLIFIQAAKNGLESQRQKVSIGSSGSPHFVGVFGSTTNKLRRDAGKTNNDLRKKIRKTDYGQLNGD